MGASSGSVLRSLRLALVLSWAFSVLGAEYRHHEDYMDGFFERWDFITSDDPTHGFVDYVSKEVAFAEQLIHNDSQGVFIGVDNRTVVPHGARGRKSIRLESLRRYDEGLFVVALRHVPASCGAWPALWMFGEDETHPWPEWGEFDIIEWVHEEDEVSAALHSKPGCSQAHVAGEQMNASWSEGKLPSVQATDCYVLAENQWMNQGCSQRAAAGSTGPAFNAQQGGTYAAEWDPRAGHVRVWSWAAGEEPQDVAGKAPRPEEWGQPQFFFSLRDNCHPEHFKNMKLVFDITFCGDRAGGANFLAHCGHMRQSDNETCTDFVRSNFSAYDEAYWSIQALDVYHRTDAGSWYDLSQAAPRTLGWLMAALALGWCILP